MTIKTLALSAAALTAAVALAIPPAHGQTGSPVVLSGTVESMTPHLLVLRHGPWEDALILTRATIASNGVDSVPVSYVPLAGAQVRVRAIQVPGVGIVAAIVEIQ
jgi:hypothetical protein